MSDKVSDDSSDSSGEQEPLHFSPVKYFPELSEQSQDESQLQQQHKQPEHHSDEYLQKPLLFSPVKYFPELSEQSQDESEQQQQHKQPEHSSEEYLQEPLLFSPVKYFPELSEQSQDQSEQQQQHKQPEHRSDEYFPGLQQELQQEFQQEQPLLAPVDNFVELNEQSLFLQQQQVQPQNTLTQYFHDYHQMQQQPQEERQQQEQLQNYAADLSPLGWCSSETMSAESEQLLNSVSARQSSAHNSNKRKISDDEHSSNSRDRPSTSAAAALRALNVAPIDCKAKALHLRDRAKKLKDDYWELNVFQYNDPRLRVQFAPYYRVYDYDPTRILLLGPSNTFIKYNKYRYVLWYDAGDALRRLLHMFFDRDTLATHSLTGRRSSRRDLPTKPILDPFIVSDIIWIVSGMCGAADKSKLRHIVSEFLNSESKSKQKRDSKK